MRKGIGYWGDMKRKSESNVSIIGGADGPTSVFIAGRTGKRSLKDRMDSHFYQKKRERVAKKIVPGTHSLEEVAAYIKEKYGATEVPETAHKYKEQKASLKEGLIIQNRSDLLGDLAEISPPEEMTDEAVVQMLKFVQKRSDFIATIPEEEMPLDYHVYEIRFGKGRMDVNIDFKWNFLNYSYSGNKKEMKQLAEIAKDIDLYYGVTEEDIRNQTKRYKKLIGMLSAD